MTRARDIADVQDNLGGAVAPVVAGKNYIIGGGFDIWQRGTSFTPNGTYTADRWRADTSATITVSQQTTGVPAGSRYCMRIAFGSTTYSDLSTSIETANVVALQGKTVAVQIKLRRNASLVGDLGFTLQKSATVDAAYGATWTSITTGTATSANLPTGTGSSDWYTLSYTATIPNDGTANSLRIIGGVTSTQSSGAYWEMAQVQLEIGSLPTPFARAGGSIGGELALCQRYYYRVNAGSNYTMYGICSTANTTNGNAGIAIPVTMRTTPTSVDSSAANTFFLQQGSAGAAYTLTAAPTFNAQIGSKNMGAIDLAVASGLTANTFYGIYSNNTTSSYIGFSAEL